jgi:uncharacterized membrane protein/YHS domain-containing protein
VVLVLAIALLAAGGAAVRAADNAVALPNVMCPVLTDQPARADIFTDYKGRRIHFCCKKCRADFLKNPAEYHLPPLAAAAPTAISGAPAEAHAYQEESKDFGDWLGAFHPAIVHFPVALILFAALAEIIYMFSGAWVFGAAARINILAGAAGAVIAMFLGWAAEDSYKGVARLGGAVEQVVAGGANVIEFHETFGILAASAAAAAAVLSEWSRRKDAAWLRRSWRTALFAAAVFVSAAGFFGGALVYGLDHYF